MCPTEASTPSGATEIDGEAPVRLALLDDHGLIVDSLATWFSEQRARLRRRGQGDHLDGPDPQPRVPGRPRAHGPAARRQRLDRVADPGVPCGRGEGRRGERARRRRLPRAVHLGRGGGVRLEDHAGRPARRPRAPGRARRTDCAVDRRSPATRRMPRRTPTATTAGRRDSAPPRSARSASTRRATARSRWPTAWTWATRPRRRTCDAFARSTRAPGGRRAASPS